MGRFDRFVAKPYEVEIQDNEGNPDTLELKPLTYAFAGDVFKVMKALQTTGIKKDDPQEAVAEKTISALGTGDTFEHVKRIVLETLKISYPEEKHEILESIAMAHIWELFPVILEKNSLSQVPEKAKKQIPRNNDQGKDTPTA